jgi:enterochelin esterase-like enzyme
LALALVSASLAVLAGAGTTGDTIGTTTTFVSITTITSPTAEFSSIVTTSPVVFMELADFMAEREGSHRMRRPALIPAPSAALITGERQEVSLLAGSQALAEDFMAAASTAAAVSMAADTGN